MTASMRVETGPLDRLARALGDPALARDIQGVIREKSVAALIGQAIHDNFDKGGPGWKPTHRGGQILKKTGLLMKSVTTPGAEGNIYSVNGSKIEWGTKLSYAAIHQNGGVITATKSRYLFIPISARAERLGPQPKGQRTMALKPGKDMIFRKSVTIPARPYLVLHAQWKMEIYNHVLQLCAKLIGKRIRQ